MTALGPLLCCIVALPGRTPLGSPSGKADWTNVFFLRTSRSSISRCASNSLGVGRLQGVDGRPGSGKGCSVGLKPQLRPSRFKGMLATRLGAYFSVHPAQAVRFSLRRRPQERIYLALSPSRLLFLYHCCWPLFYFIHGR